MAWFLDTNIVIYCLRAKSPAAMRRLQAVPPVEVRVPLQAHAELLVGAAKSNNPSAALARVQAFLTPFATAWPDAAVEQHYVEIRTVLERAGTPISEADLWIAATARAAAATLVTTTRLSLPASLICPSRIGRFPSRQVWIPCQAANHPS